jgi:hypothetical protein
VATETDESTAAPNGDVGSDAGPSQPIDLTSAPPEGHGVQEEAPRTGEWEGRARWVALGIGILLGATTIGTMLQIVYVAGVTPTARLQAVLQWGTTVLPTVVSFGSAAAGYYFGRRSH